MHCKALIILFKHFKEYFVSRRKLDQVKTITRANFLLSSIILFILRVIRSLWVLLPRAKLLQTFHIWSEAENYRRRNTATWSGYWILTLSFIHYVNTILHSFKCALFTLQEETFTFFFNRCVGSICIKCLNTTYSVLKVWRVLQNRIEKTFI